MSLGGQNFLSAIQNDPSAFGIGYQPSAYAPNVDRGSVGKGGALPPEDEQALRYYIESQPQAMQAFNNAGAITDPTALAQQAILTRPMRPSFTGQQLMSREVPVGIQGNSGLAYPSMASTGLLNVPSYTSRYAGTDSGGGGGGGGGGGQTTAGGLDTYGSYNSLTNGLVGALMGNLSQPSLSIPVDNMGTYANQPAFNFGSGMTGVGNPGEAAAAEAAAANNVAAGLAAAADAEAAAQGGGGYSASDYGGYSGSETQSSGESYAN